ncbi:MAG: hypothetical protein JWO05_3670 [Gemmatimonadetes bacterium]|nr:hypothetical protein [Gemmatimonadota bacterium]
MNATNATYRITVPSANPAAIHVEAEFTVRDGRVFMDSIQAQHLPRGWATFVRDLVMEDSSGRPLPFVEVDSAAWRLETAYAGQLRLRYDVDLAYARGSWPTGAKQSGQFFDDSTFYSVSKALFIVSHDAGRSRVHFTLPAGWHVTVPWDSVGGGAMDFLVDDATDLLRNTIVVGPHRVQAIHQGSFTLLLALPGRMRDARPLIEPAVRRILHEYLVLYARTPPSRLMVTFFYAGAEDGEAFRKSAALTTAGVVSANSRVIWGNFLAHEIFHHWNGQAIRGAESASRQFFSEGFTEYYANRTIVRTGLISTELFLRKVETQLALYGYFRAAGAFSGISLQAAGGDKARYRFGVYQGGWTLAFCLDGRIREITHDRRSLDDVMRRMYERFGLTAIPYRAEDIVRVAGEVAGTDFTELFSSSVAGTATLPTPTCLHRMGLEGFGKPYAAELYVFRNAAATVEERRRLLSLMGTAQARH